MSQGRLTTKEAAQLGKGFLPFHLPPSVDFRDEIVGIRATVVRRSRARSSRNNDVRMTVSAGLRRDGIVIRRITRLVLPFRRARARASRPPPKIARISKRPSPPSPTPPAPTREVRPGIVCVCVCCCNFVQDR